MRALGDTAAGAADTTAPATAVGSAPAGAPPDALRPDWVSAVAVPPVAVDLDRLFPWGSAQLAAVVPRVAALLAELRRRREAGEFEYRPAGDRLAEDCGDGGAPRSSESSSAAGRAVRPAGDLLGGARGARRADA